MLGRAIAAADVVGHNVIGIDTGEIAIDQYERDAVGLEPPDRLVVCDITDGKDDHPGHTVGAQPGDIAILLLQALLGIGEAHLIAA